MVTLHLALTVYAACVGVHLVFCNIDAAFKWLPRISESNLENYYTESIDGEDRALAVLFGVKP